MADSLFGFAFGGQIQSHCGLKQTVVIGNKPSLSTLTATVALKTTTKITLMPTGLLVGF
jgi:hypothetical protein